MKIEVVADSISLDGDRIISVLANLNTEKILRLHRYHPHLHCTFPAQHEPLPIDKRRRVLITAGDFGDVYSDIDLEPFGDGLAEKLDGRVPTTVDDNGMHAPFTSDGERRNVDLSLLGMLSAARCQRNGDSDGMPTDIELYQKLLGGDPAQRGGMRHPALPVSHAAFVGRKVPTGVIEGWLSWHELLDWRGEPL